MNVLWFTDTKTPVDFTAGYRIAHTNTAAASAKAVPKRLCSTTRRSVPLNSMTQFSQLGLTGWQRVLAHDALSNWDCKVNVRRIAKDGSTLPFTTTRHAWFSQLAAHQQISHQCCPQVSDGLAFLEYWKHCHWRQQLVRGCMKRNLQKQKAAILISCYHTVEVAVCYQGIQYVNLPISWC